ncbi:MAG: hypothetical protein AB7I19_01695 [Planctomycetota bacterium]
MRISPRFGLAAGLVLLGACSSGGSNDRFGGSVKLTANHFLFGLVGRPAFPAFPTTTGDLETVNGRFFLRDDGKYEMRQSTGTLLSQSDYALENDGTLAIAVPSSGSTLVYRGGYGLRGTTGDVVLTDRVGSGVGVYFGTKLVVGPADLTPIVGDWHLFTLHAILAPAGSVPDEDLIGVAFGGDLTLAADGSFTGDGTESEVGTVAIRGAANDFQALSDSRFAIEATYDPPARPDYERGFTAGGNSRILIGLDEETGSSDTAAGIALMLKKRTAAYSAADLAGKYRLGLLTVFLRTTAAGIDSSVGELDLQSNGNFRISAQNNQGQDFSYTGTWTGAADGTLLFTVTGTNETWQGAFDDAYQTVIFVDNFKESRTNLQVELNLGMAIRPPATTP